MSLKLSLSKKEFKGPDDSVFIYQIPSKTKAVSIFMAGSVNGKIDPAIWIEGKIDPEKQIKYSYNAAKEYIVGWRNVVDEDGNDIPFEKEYIEYIDIEVIAEFVSEIVFPSLMEIIGIEKEDSEEEGVEEAPLAT